MTAKSKIVVTPEELREVRDLMIQDSAISKLMSRLADMQCSVETGREVYWDKLKKKYNLNRDKKYHIHVDTAELTEKKDK